MLTGWRWARARPTPAACRASLCCRPPTGHSLPAT
ncbi:hypothetical protein CRUP_005589 [Coryphaenoides rupestris]|nr:hypothetical protein CRUP_005589 [Coryphaenoides rupestris]